MSSGKVSWGKVVVGAAIVAGAVAAIALFPDQVDKVGGSIKDALATTYGAIGDAGKWVLAKLGSFAHLLAENKEVAITGAALAGGVAGAALHKKHDESAELEQQTFAEREDMRRMQALMLARMQAQGYQPAMAMNSQGRA